MIYKHLPWLFLIPLLFLTNHPLHAQTKTRIKNNFYNFDAPDINVDENNLAIGGYDPVAYFREGEAVVGNPKYQVVYEGALFQFVKKKHLRLFSKNPRDYMPQFGGYCALGVCFNLVSPAYPNGKYEADPENFEIYDGKLYLFYPEDTFPAKQTWGENKRGYIKAARDIWKSFVH